MDSILNVFVVAWNNIVDFKYKDILVDVITKILFIVMFPAAILIYNKAESHFCRVLNQKLANKDKQIESLHLLYSQKMQDKDAEYRLMIQDLTRTLSTSKSDCDVRLEKSTDTFADAVKVMTTQLQSQNGSMDSMKGEMTQLRYQVENQQLEIKAQERFVMAAFEFIRYSSLEIQFTKKNIKMIQDIQTKYPYLTFESSPPMSPISASFSLPPSTDLSSTSTASSSASSTTASSSTDLSSTSISSSVATPMGPILPTPPIEVSKRTRPIGIKNPRNVKVAPTLVNV